MLTGGRLAAGWDEFGRQFGELALCGIRQTCFTPRSVRQCPFTLPCCAGSTSAAASRSPWRPCRDLFGDLGFAGATTLLQSGNVVFRSDRKADATLERLLERETANRLAVAADYVVRSADEWEQVVARNPFTKEAKDDPGHLVAMFLKSAPKADDVEALRSSIQGPEVIRADGKQLYIVYPEGIGRSKLTGTLIEKRLGTRHGPELEHGPEAARGVRVIPFHRSAFSR